VCDTLDVLALREDMVDAARLSYERWEQLGRIFESELALEGRDLNVCYIIFDSDPPDVFQMMYEVVTGAP